ncbi:hypothetical protein [Streptomyces mirabilis]|uniref:hypothetical protein n=1 Tax=Streptomyces mirabilis TaxID=68239 RepID=UPI0031BB3964
MRRLCVRLDVLGEPLRVRDPPRREDEPRGALQGEQAEGWWTKAAVATDADVFSAPYKKGLKLIDPRRTVTARKVLGPTTTPLSNGGGGGSRGNGGSGGALEV